MVSAQAFERDVPGSNPGGVGHFLSAMSLGKTDSPGPTILWMANTNVTGNFETSADFYT